ncbi:MAG: glycosyltransferase [Acidimicrobiales bacterium]
MTTSSPPQEAHRPGRPLQVLHVIKGLGPGGAEQLLVNQARFSQRDDVEFTVAYVLGAKTRLVADLEHRGWRTVCIGDEDGSTWRWMDRLRSLIRRRGVAVVHGHSPAVAAACRLVVRSLPPSERPATIYTEHNCWDRHHPLTRFANRITIGLEDHVIAVSGAVRDSMSRSADFEVLVHGIDVESVSRQAGRRDAVRRELGFARDDFVIGTVANHRREKDYPTLLGSARRTLDADPTVRFVAVGQGPLQGAAEAARDDLGLGEAFRFLGYRSDAVEVMSAFDLFTLTSTHEGLPVALMEALALGLPVVATRVGGIPEATAGTDAVLVEPGDEQALADAYLAAKAAPCHSRQPVAFDAARSAGRLIDHYLALADRRTKTGVGCA